MRVFFTDRSSSIYCCKYLNIRICLGYSTFIVKCVFLPGRKLKLKKTLENSPWNPKHGGFDYMMFLLNRLGWFCLFHLNFSKGVISFNWNSPVPWCLVSSSSSIFLGRFMQNCRIWWSNPEVFFGQLGYWCGPKGFQQSCIWLYIVTCVLYKLLMWLKPQDTGLHVDCSRWHFFCTTHFVAPSFSHIVRNGETCYWRGC